jgi:hypothetical protein
MASPDGAGGGAAARAAAGGAGATTGIAETQRLEAELRRQGELRRRNWRKSEQLKQTLHEARTRRGNPELIRTLEVSIADAEAVVESRQKLMSNIEEELERTATVATERAAAIAGVATGAGSLQARPCEPGAKATANACVIMGGGRRRTRRHRRRTRSTRNRNRRSRITRKR